MLDVFAHGLSWKSWLAVFCSRFVLVVVGLCVCSWFVLEVSGWCVCSWFVLEAAGWYVCSWSVLAVVAACVYSWFGLEVAGLCVCSLFVLAVSASCVGSLFVLEGVASCVCSSLAAGNCLYQVFANCRASRSQKWATETLAQVDQRKGYGNFSASRSQNRQRKLWRDFCAGFVGGRCHS